MLLWSHQSVKRQQTAKLFQLKADMVTAWLRRWNTQTTTDQLADAPYSGRRPKISLYTLNRILEAAHFRWKRVLKSMKGQ